MSADRLARAIVVLANAVGGRDEIARQCVIPESVVVDWAFGVGVPDREQWMSLHILARRLGVEFPAPPGDSDLAPSSRRPSRPPPTRTEEEQPFRAVSHAPRGRRGFPVTVLVVDDDPHFRRAVRELLERDGFEVDEASNGVEALDKLSSEGLVPDVLLIDLRMPHMDGSTLLERLRARRTLASIPTIIVSAYVATEPFDGGRRVLSKHEALDSLVNDVREVLGRCA